MAKVVIHIGTGKTGTTAVQKFMWKNRENFLRQGFDYTKIGAYPPGFAHHVLSHKWGGWIPAEKLKNFPRPDDEWNSLKELVKSTEKTVVISSERFTGLSTRKNSSEVIDFVAKIFSGCDVTVVGYVRRQDEFLESAFKQALKTGMTQAPFEKYLETPPQYCYYDKVFDAWADKFGTENVFARVYDKKLFKDGDVVSDFAFFLGADLNSDFSWDAVEVNRSLSSISALILSHPKIDLKKLQPDAKARIRRRFDDFKTSNHSLLCPEQRAEILDNFRQSNQNLTEKYIRYDVQGWMEVSAEETRATFQRNKKYFSYADLDALLQLLRD